MIRGSVTASLIGYALLMHVKELGQLLIEISSLLEKISRGLYHGAEPYRILAVKHRILVVIFGLYS